MVQPLTDEQLDYLLDFIGYGTLAADVWFLGMEEAGGGEDNIHTRLNFQTVEDCAKAHKLLGVTKLHWGKRIIQPTWRGMCYIMLRLQGQEPTRSSIRRYQAEELGRFGGTTLLTELMPIPKPNFSGWAYDKLIPQFSSRSEYYRLVKPRRVRYLRRLIDQRQPKVVIGYGKVFWAEYKALFERFRFLTKEHFEVAFDGTTLVILTRHFTARTMNGKFDDVVSIIRSHVTL
jgi:hypothetical protein